MRRTLTWTLIALGLALMTVGYLASAPWGADAVSDSNPRIDFAPALFVLGVIVAFSSALVYELLPSRRK